MSVSITLHPDVQRFAPGTTVKAYKKSNWPIPGAPSGTPEGTQDASATVATDGSVSFTGLTAETNYYLYAASPDRYASFSTKTESVGAASYSGAQDFSGATVTLPSGITIPASSVDSTALASGAVTAAKIADALKPSGSAVAATEALRALGTTSSKAAAGDDARLSDVRGVSFTAGTHAARLLVTTPAAGRIWKETNTGLLYIGDGAAWQILSGRGHVLKTADETVNNSTTLQDDDHLVFPIEANEIWSVEVLLDLQAISVNADFKFGFNVPAGASYKLQLTSNAGGTGTGASPSTVQTASVATGAANANFLSAIIARINNGATAGTVALQWAQNTLTAEDNKVLSGSFLRLQRLA